MRVCIQKVKHASCVVNNKEISSISNGLLLFVGFTETDQEATISWMVHKILNLRIFEDENEVMNRSLLQVGGEILCISQFTLYASCNKGNRPSYTQALASNRANILYQMFVKKLQEQVPTQMGAFGEMMEISLTNMGPTTIILER